MSIPWPIHHTTFKDWADSLHLLMPQIDIQPIINDKTPWQAWAAQVVQSQSCQNVGVPRPDGYKTWQLWAADMIRCFGVQA